MIFTNEHLEQFSGVRIRILPKCWIRICQNNPSKLKQFKQKWRKWFESLKGGFESRLQNVQTKESEDSDSNPYEEDSNPNSSKFS